MSQFGEKSLIKDIYVSYKSNNEWPKCHYYKPKGLDWVTVVISIGTGSFITRSSAEPSTVAVGARSKHLLILVTVNKVISRIIHNYEIAYCIPDIIRPKRYPHVNQACLQQFHFSLVQLFFKNPYIFFSFLNMIDV